MSKIVIPKIEIPFNRPAHIFAENTYQLVSRSRKLKPKYSGENFIRLKIDWDIEKIKTDILNATKKYKWWGWVRKNIDTPYTEKDKIRTYDEGIDDINRSSYYGGWSIKYNPIYCNLKNLSKEASGMGELPSPLSWFIFSNLGSKIYKELEESQQLIILTRIAVEKGYDAVIRRLIDQKLIDSNDIAKIKIPQHNLPKNLHHEKDSYFDTWSFTKFTDASKESGIEKLLSDTNCQVLRSRVAWQRGSFRNYRENSTETGKLTADRYNWHSDEETVHNTRIVIPIQTSNAYGIEIKNKSPVPLEIGYAYTWNTHIVHRQIQIDNESKLDRIYLVLGFNPWFNWSEKDNAWISNDYYEKIHPLDMVSEGLIIPSLKFNKELI